MLFTTQSSVVIPKLNEIYDHFHILVPPLTHPLLLVLILFFAVAQIIAGVHLEKKVRKHHELVERYLLPIITIFAIDGLLALFTGLLSAIQSPSAILDQFFIGKL